MNFMSILIGAIGGAAAAASDHLLRRRLGDGQRLCQRAQPIHAVEDDHQGQRLDLSAWRHDPVRGRADLHRRAVVHLVELA